MPIPCNVLINADDLGLSAPINEAIAYCFDLKYINSTSLLTNMPGFDHAIGLIATNDNIRNIGVHINFAEGKPLSSFKEKLFLKDDGSWDTALTNKKTGRLSDSQKEAFLAEIYAQIDKALQHDVYVTHLDSHYHLHTLPCFYLLFIKAATRYKLKLRLAQTYREGSCLKYFYRKYINARIISRGLNYTTYFETVNVYLSNNGEQGRCVEVMVHPGFDSAGSLTDHYNPSSLLNWLNFVKTGLAH
ncbi:ChbG/HpnK family deacetylase [Mucilaginibacter glaciei]|uniref:ChbG/HpnK family deacetylase n=1 Tax=Mucilaginibacter glaciei TaxID=2772109 RepID=A0A926S2M0_9SPHI|nr:ChbG/HpnK family deacetylase [Mucilaginibacter glaciei]MBD1393339.1 ChbG/HpnK family deacetylase [Mucilaginibacter glaciei]